MRMMTQSREETIRAAELALAETLRKARAEIVKHVEVGEGVRVPRNVQDAVQDVLEALDATIEDLTSERDAEIDDAIEDIDR
jgi:uncharacterized protein (UPF0147 family)